MNFYETYAYEILKREHERRGDRSPQPLGTVKKGLFGAPLEEQLQRTQYRRELMELIGITVSRRWLRRQ